MDLLEGNALEIGDESNNEEIYVSLQYVYLQKIYGVEIVNTINGSDEEKTLCLTTIMIPKKLRRQGNCSKILDILENRANREGVPFVVGPLLDWGQEDIYLPDILQKRKYVPISGGVIRKYVPT